MTDAKRDNNQVTTMLAVSSTDGSTPVNLRASPALNAILISDGTTGTDQSNRSDARRDGSQVPVLMAVSSADGRTPVMLYLDSSNLLLIKST